MEELCIATWVANFKAGKYDSKDRETQIDAGWYDWFCKETSLANKTKQMGNIIKQIRFGGKVDLKTNYVWFKNNCPMSGQLYDDFRFADIKTKDVLFTITINKPRESTRYTVYGSANGFIEPLFQTSHIHELVRWFSEV